jgi:pre-mRNA-processing factor 6
LESYDNAKLVLNTAIQTIPTDHNIWISASMLEESQGNHKKVFDMIKKAFKKLQKAKVNIPR